VLVDVAMMLNGRSHLAVFEELVGQVLKAADTDGNGQATWDELAANEKYLADYQPNGQPVSARQLKMWIEQLDENRDGQIQPGEAAGWLGRNSGTTARAFTLRSSRWYHANPRASSRVWQLLDTNRDARLSTEEIADAADRFFQFDANDDRVISPAELASLREQLDAGNPEVMATSREVTRYAAIHLDAAVAVDRLEFLLSDLYSPRQMLGPTSFPDLSGLFAKLDANADNWLEQQELASLRTIEPHLQLTATFNDGSGESQVEAARLTLDAHSPEVTVVAQSANRVVVSIGGTRLIVSAHDLQPGQTAGQEIERNQIHAMVHDQCDAMFEELDANSDGRLGEREIATGAEQLLRRDANADRQLSTDELTCSMIVAFLRGEGPNEDAFYIPATRAARQIDAQTPAWFVSGDFNGDGDISRREFLGSFEQFARLDTDQNGYIGVAEAVALKQD
jgi:Ca2+-binding EF-hand superfamily protein